jgi:hypothetical protein
MKTDSLEGDIKEMMERHKELESKLNEKQPRDYGDTSMMSKNTLMKINAKLHGF